MHPGRFPAVCPVSLRHKAPPSRPPERTGLASRQGFSEFTRARKALPKLHPPFERTGIYGRTAMVNLYFGEYGRGLVTPQQMAKNRWGATAFRVTSRFCATGYTPSFTQPSTKSAAPRHLTSDQKLWGGCVSAALPEKQPNPSPLREREVGGRFGFWSGGTVVASQVSSPAAPHTFHLKNPARHSILDCYARPRFRGGGRNFDRGDVGNCETQRTGSPLGRGCWWPYVPEAFGDPGLQVLPRQDGADL